MAVKLFEEHKHILDAADAFLAALKCTPRPPMETLSRLRVRMSSLIRRHRVTEEAFVYGPLASAGGLHKFPQLQATVQDLMREKVKYSEHIRYWTPQRIEADWEGYIVACEERVAATRRTIAEEEAGIYQVMLSLTPEQTPLPADR